MKNHEKRSIGSTPFPEVNGVYAHHARRGRGHGRNYDHERNPFLSVNHSPKKNHYQREKRKGIDEKCKAIKTNCFQYGGRGHCTRDCRTPKHLVELYQASLRKKDKNYEANFITEHVDIIHLDMTNFFTHPKGKIDHLIGDDSVDMKEQSWLIFANNYVINI
ncbi:hypothetical protein EJD97_024388 [Solanum chilense]|uniref:CCHC-type domain-containing protein n=1 Tax=Solanum chilense TaxID=4083 RepID=A0A6N2AUT4_SOLCI|nr:hypothetical protein EJD97_024388 [Solanum chilense]